ncbi:MAG: histidine phosphatase family protein [Bacteroidetes bacterium]|nr:histidine phosphatase family protein [Bacteroidota bacterium]
MQIAKTLYLIRHSKADFMTNGISDLERSLTAEGISDSHLVANKLLQLDVKWDLLISSIAFRAINTAIIFSEKLGHTGEKILLTEKLYETKLEDYIDVVGSIKKEYNNVALFGHNQTISELSFYLSEKIIDFNTTTVVELLIAGGWDSITANCAEVKNVINVR